MGTRLLTAKTRFSTLVTDVQPVIAQFIVWLDEKVAEYKINGYMNLDSGPDAPQWIKDYSMSILVSGMSGGERSDTETQSDNASPRKSKPRSPPPHPPPGRSPPLKRHRRSFPGPEDTKTKPVVEDFDVIEIKEEKDNDDEYLQDNGESSPNLPIPDVLRSPSRIKPSLSSPSRSTLSTSTPSHPSLPHRTSTTTGITETESFDMSVESFDDNHQGPDVEGDDIKPFAYKNVSLADSENADNVYPGTSTDGSYYGMPGFDDSAMSDPADQQTEGISSSGDFSAQYEEFKITMNKDYMLAHPDSNFQPSDPHYAEYSPNKPKARTIRLMQRVCRFCGKIFLRKDHYDDHLRIHTGERPYQCAFCEKRFKQKVTCTGHERIHTGSRPFTCLYCDATFNRRYSCNTHQKHCQLNQRIAIEREKVQIASETFQPAENTLKSESQHDDV